MMVKLKRDGEDGYVTVDGRFTIKPVTMGCGGTGWAGGRGFSNGHREWEVTDTTERAQIDRHGKHRTIVHALFAVRDVVEWVLEQEARP